MINSMTGFGRACVEQDGRELTVELKSVNHRYLDLGLRLPRHLSFLEDVFRQALSERFARGHIDVYVNYRNRRQDARTVNVDETLMGAYVAAARSAAQSVGLADDLALSDVLRLPDILTVSEAEEDREAVVRLVLATVGQAAEELAAMRQREGTNLSRDLSANADTVLALAREIAQRAPLVVAEYKQKLQERIAELMDGAAPPDPVRLATEVAIFADKAGIDEELVRLESHVRQFKSMLNEREPVGRKLDFIVQEMNREFNTIGSKANDGEITKRVIDGKGEIEKIREQVQNIE